MAEGGIQSRIPDQRFARTSEGGGKAEIVAECFNRGEHPDSESKWPRKEIDLGNNKLTLGKAKGEAMLPAETKNLPGVIHMGGEVLGEDQDIVHVDETERKFTQNK